MAKLKSKTRTPGTGTGRGRGDDDADDDEDDDEDDNPDSRPMSRGETLRLVNSAVSAQLARKLPAAVEAGVAPVMTGLDEIRTAIAGGGAGKGKASKGKRKPAEDDDEDDAGGGNVEVAELRKTVDTLNGKLKEQEQARAKEAREVREGKAMGALRESLGKIKVDPLRMKGALAVVGASLSRDKEGNIVLDEEGNPQWRAKRDGYDEDIGIEAGVGEWAATDEGKSYQAATGTPGGSGVRPPRGQASGAGGRTQLAAESKAQRLAQAKQDLAQGVAQMLGGGVLPDGG